MEFPSPFGVRVLKCLGRLDGRKSVGWFPSPFGVRVPKSAGESRIRGWWSTVSVPFRGSCSEMRPKHGGMRMG